MDHETTLPTNEKLFDGPPAVKTEPDIEEATFVETGDPSDILEGATDLSFAAEEIFDTTDAEQNLADMLQEFNTNTGSERAPTPDEDLKDLNEAIAAVNKKREEIAVAQNSEDYYIDQEALELEQIELHKLEMEVAQIQKRLQKAQDFEQQERERENNAMFVSIEDITDDEFQSTPTPSRHEAMNLHNYIDVDMSDDEDEIVVNDNYNSSWSPPETSKPRGGRATKPSTRGRKSGPKTGTTRVQKAFSKAAKGKRGAKNGPTMLNLESLVHNDIVAHALVNQAAGELPSIEGITNRKDALKALIASIPEEERDTTRGDRAALVNAARQFQSKGQRTVQVKGEGWRLQGMESNLKHFQLLGAAWGCARESGDRAPYGGILADTMGYGKTVQMIAIMVENQPKPRAKNRTTLVVVPSSLVNQWITELGRHTKVGTMDRVIAHTAGHRIDAPDVAAALRQFDVVVTTYSEVMRNYPKCKPPLHLVTDGAKDSWWRNYYNTNKGPLLSMPFYRVVLDEAQTIKNHESQTSKACRLLTAKYKWVLSGTPLSNCMEELFSYFSFLGVDGAATFAQFKNNYAKRTDVTMQRLDAILRTIMIRRTGGDRLMGKPLVSLPALDHQTIELSLNPVERAIYMVVRQRFITRINDWSNSNKMSPGQLSKNIFVMLLRLRQMCAHVLMVSSVLRDSLESEDIEKLWKSIERHSQASNDMGRRTARVLKKVLQEARDEQQTSATNTSNATLSNDQNQTIDLTIDDAAMNFRAFFHRMYQDGSWDKVKSRSRCHSCKEIPEGTVKVAVPCGHLYCEECIQVLLESAESANTTATCSECEGAITEAADMQALERIAAEAGNRRISSPLEALMKTNDKKEKKELEMEWLTIPGVEFMSTKVQAVVATMEEWLRKDPEAKIVVFTLFLPMVELLAKVCHRKDWGYQKHTGAITLDVRNKALAKWKDPEEANQKVLLMSMRAGGLGLNLVEARYVIIIDPWWNEAAEDQAFSRVYRIGQTQDCEIKRFVIKDAIDTQLMLHLQKLKAQECDRVIDGRSKDKFEVKDLMKLFGPTRRDPNTNELIIDDEQDANYAVDEFIMGDEDVVVIESDNEEVYPAPSRPED